MDNNGPFFTTESWGCVEAENPYGQSAPSGSKKTDEAPTPGQTSLSRILSQSDETEETLPGDCTDEAPTNALSQEREEPGVLQNTLVIENAEFGLGMIPCHTR